jgi:hypothetical protein
MNRSIAGDTADGSAPGSGTELVSTGCIESGGVAGDAA